MYTHVNDKIDLTNNATPPPILPSLRSLDILVYLGDTIKWLLLIFSCVSVTAITLKSILSNASKTSNLFSLLTRLLALTCKIENLLIRRSSFTAVNALSGK